MSESHQDSSYFSDDPQLRGGMKIWRLWIPYWVLVVVPLLLVLGVSAKPAYRAYREYRIDTNLEAAKAAARLEDWATARDKAHSVLLARQGDFEAYRIWTRALGKMGDPRTYLLATQLLTDPRSTREDRLESLQVMAVQAPQAVALSAFAYLPEELRKQAAFRAAITPLLLLRGEVKLAEKSLREAAEPTDEPKVRLALLLTLCSRPEPARVAEARGIFAGLIAAKADTEALAALLVLGETPGGLAPGEPLPDLPQWLKQQPQAKALHHLLGMEPALQALPDAAEHQYASAIGRFLATEPGVLGTWLVRHGQAERVAQLLEELAKTRSDAYLARLHALLRLQKETEMKSALAEPPASADLVEIETVQAGVASNQGTPKAAAAAWTRAMNHAAADTTRNRFIEIARAAELQGAKQAAENAWVAAVRLGWGQLPLYRDLLPVFSSLADQGRSEDLLAMYRTLLRYEPHNAELHNNFLYLGLIHGLLQPAEVVTAQAKLVAENPARPDLISTLMFAEMLAGHPADALARLPAARDGGHLPPLLLTALEGTARVLAGETEAGTALLKQVNWSLFLRQERIAFRDPLLKLKIADLPLPELKSDSTSDDVPLPELKSDTVEAAPDQIPAWRKAIERLEKDRAGDVLPALPAPRVPGADLPAAPPENP
jgi:hypothetical protein